jgi:hypothetical protein
MLMTTRWAVAVALTVAVAACSRSADVEKVPVGSDVQVTRNDGGVVEGTLAARDETSVKVDVGTATKDVPKKDVAAVTVIDPAAEPPAPPPMAKFREYTVPSGTKISVRLADEVGSGTSKVGDTVEAVLAEAVVVDGAEALPAGSAVTGEVADVQQAGKVKGRASLALRFTRVTAHGENYPLAARFTMVAPATKEQDAKTIGIPAAGGAVIGAIVGGKKGAAVGAAVGGGAGTARVLMTAGQEVALPEGTELSLTTSNAVDVRIPIVQRSAAGR